MRPLATQMYKGYVKMFLETIFNEHPMDDFVSAYIKKKPRVNYSTAEVKWKILNAAYEEFKLR